MKTIQLGHGSFFSREHRMQAPAGTGLAQDKSTSVNIKEKNRPMGENPMCSYVGLNCVPPRDRSVEALSLRTSGRGWIWTNMPVLRSGGSMQLRTHAHAGNAKTFFACGACLLFQRPQN